METLLAILLALAIYVVIPVMIGLGICSIAILYDRKFNKKDKTKTVDEAEKIIKQKTREKEVNKVR